MENLHKSFRTIAKVSIISYAVVLFITAGMWANLKVSQVRIEEITQNNQLALCVFRADLQQRVDSTTQYLEDHPEGIAGIPIATIRQSLENQKRTIVALNIIDCPIPTDT